jgi:hypothetical protein
MRAMRRTARIAAWTCGILAVIAYPAIVALWACTIALGMPFNSVPLTLTLTLALALIPFLLIPLAMILSMIADQRPTPASPRCVHCSYDLSHRSDARRCPECGKGVD